VERAFTPQWSGELELTAPALPARIADPEGRPLELARILVRAAGTPLGFLELESPGGRLDQQRAVSQAQLSFGQAASEAISGDDWTEDGDEHVSVVLCTRNRATGARRTLASLLALQHRQLELIVVDNAPEDDSTRELVEAVARRDGRVRYVREPRRGLSCARNRGLREASGEFIAFTDDDVTVDPLWINGLLRGFARQPDVGCVTGLVASAALRHGAEQYFDQRVWWSSSCTPRVYTAQRGAADSPLHPYTAGVFGTGANFAGRVSVLRALGGFDECLGAGSPAQGGEDLDVFVRLITAGFPLSYEPSALVWHEHRIDDESLRRQMYAYGLGLTAYLTKYMLERRSRAALLRLLPCVVRHGLMLARRSRAAAGGAALDQAGMSAVELRGMFAGPLAYLGARRRADPEHLRAVAP
jgi:glycosyltransferase involved in cell wall biosynthesis